MKARPKTGTDDILFFPKLRCGYRRPADKEVYSQATFAFRLAVDVRAFLEDIEGAPDFPHYLKTLKLRLLEMLYELNMIASYADPMEELHFAALALEYGVSDVADLDGQDLIDIFDLFDDFDSETVNIDGVVRFFEALIEAFPGQVPDPLEPKGQRVLLKALRNWDKICSTAGVDAKFIQDLLKEV